MGERIEHWTAHVECKCDSCGTEWRYELRCEDDAQDGPCFAPQRQLLCPTCTQGGVRLPPPVLGVSRVGTYIDTRQIFLPKNDG